MSMPKSPVIEKPELDDYIDTKIEIAVLKYDEAMPFRVDEKPQGGLDEDLGNE